MKENSYREQLKKMTDKYGQSESERQKAIIEYNNLLAQLDSTDKKNQYMSRDKQRLLNE